MKNKLLILFGVLLLSNLYMLNVSAKNLFYQNENGVMMSKNEYDYFSKIYFDGYQEYITQEEYDNIKKMDLFDKDIIKEEIVQEEFINNSITRGAIVTSHLRTLTIGKSCSNECLITLVTSWDGMPYIKNYDVIGARLSNSSLKSISTTRVTGNNYIKSYNNPQKFNDGFGFSVLLPNASNLKITTTFTTSKSGVAYGSYQHASSNTTEYVSKQYTIGMGEYGNVFRFIGTARTVYDNAPGVNITLN